MDRQMQFVMIWANANQALFEWIVKARKEHGDEKAHEMWVDKCVNFMLPDDKLEALDDENDFAYWICCAAQMYQDLMWRFGVFDDADS